jgi:hypothetical protein
VRDEIRGTEIDGNREGLIGGGEEEQENESILQYGCVDGRGSYEETLAGCSETTLQVGQPIAVQNITLRYHADRRSGTFRRGRCTLHALYVM